MTTRRLDKFRQYFSGEIHSAPLYLIILFEEIVGGAYIWTGWQAVEAEYVDPRVELAFIHPTVQQHTSIIREKLHERLRTIKEDHSS